MISRGILRNVTAVLSRSGRSFSLLTSRGLNRPARPSSIHQVPSASFSKQVSKLVAQLGQEIKFENDEYKELDGVEKFQKKNGFQIEESENSKLVVFKKKDENGNMIQVLFEARTPVQDDNYQNQTEEAEEEAPDNIDDFSEFTVTVSKDGKRGLVFDCAAYNGELTVNYVTVSDDVEASSRDNKYGRGTNEYIGPEFSSLDERLQVAIQGYLHGLGVDDNLVSFVDLFALDKEQRLYMKWLNDMKDFLDE